MENNSESFNHETGLKVIYEMIASAKGKIGKNYIYYLLWGYLVLAACISEYLLLKLAGFKYHYLVWPVFMGSGLIITGIFAFGQSKKSYTKTYIGSFFQYFYIGWIITLFILLFFGGHDRMLPFAMAMYGLAIFVSGGIIRFRFLIPAGIVAWAGSVTAFYMPYEMQLIVMTGVVVLSYIIPGHILRTASKKQ
jgi:hypothetical protein